MNLGTHLHFKFCHNMWSVMASANILPFQRCIHTTCVHLKSLRAGRHRVSRYHNKSLTYDQAFKPDKIAVTKGWLSVHSGNLRDEKGSQARLYEDRFIRRFMEGTFHRLMPTDIVIKRRFNIVEVIAFVTKRQGDKLVFLKSYSERILSAFLKCNVKLYLHFVTEQEVKYKFI